MIQLFSMHIYLQLNSIFLWHPSSYILYLFALFHVPHHHSHITVCKANTRTAQQHVSSSRFHQSYRSCVYQNCRMELLSTVSSRGSAHYDWWRTSEPPPGSLYFRSPVNPNALVFWLFHACFHVKRALHPKLSLVWNQISRSLKVPYCTPFRSFIFGVDFLKNIYISAV